MVVPRLTRRRNVLLGTKFVGGVLWAPMAGTELGYDFTRTLEGTIGFNGRGEILGLRVKI
jgi:hypothetical protein